VSITRRKFLQASSVFTLFSIIPTKPIVGETSRIRDVISTTADAESGALAYYTKATFESYLNSIFQLQTAKGTVALTLIEVGDLPAPKGGECFKLLFRGGKQSYPQATYTLVHPSLGTMQLLLVPAGFDQQAVWECVATINRLSLVDSVINKARKRG
jgi:Domain of unknown function (DUF6916)